MNTSRYAVVIREALRRCCREGCRPATKHGGGIVHNLRRLILVRQANERVCVPTLTRGEAGGGSCGGGGGAASGGIGFRFAGVSEGPG